MAVKKPRYKKPNATPLAHIRIRIGIGIPYSEPELHTTQSGGTPYGASSVGQEPSLTAEEIRLAQQLGKRLATTAKKLKGSQ